MPTVRIPTGTHGNGDRLLQIEHGIYPGTPEDYVSIRVGYGSDTVGVGATRANILKGIEEAFDVTITPNPPRIGTSVHEAIESYIKKDEDWKPEVGAVVEAYWQLYRASQADVVVVDNDDCVWSYEFDHETATFDWAPAVHDQKDVGDPEGVHLMECLPARIIYVRDGSRDN